jgi:hypothetical protein
VSSLFVCCLLSRIAPPRRPAVAWEPVIEPSRSFCRCRCRRRRARSLALRLCRTLVPTSARRVPARCRHPHTEHATAERRPCLFGPGVVRAQTPVVCTSPLAVALFMSLVVHLLSALCHRHGCAADLYQHKPTPGRGPVLPGRTCARALTHRRGRSPAYVPNRRRRAVPRRFPFLCSFA